MGIWSNVVVKQIVLVSVSRSLSDSITTPIRHIRRHMVCTISRFSKKNFFFALTPTGGSKTCLNRYDPEEPQYLYICSKHTTVYNFKMYHCCIIPAIFFTKVIRWKEWHIRHFYYCQMSKQVNLTQTVFKGYSACLTLTNLYHWAAFCSPLLTVHDILYWLVSLTQLNLTVAVSIYCNLWQLQSLNWQVLEAKTTLVWLFDESELLLYNIVDMNLL